MLESERFKKIQQNRKCFAYIAIFVVFQIIVLAIFGATVMKIKTPNVRLRSVTVQSLDYSSGSNSPFFNMTLIAEVSVRNKNFGHFKFDPTKANVTFGGVIVGQGDIIKARAKARKTKRMNVTIEVNSDGISDGAKLGTEVSSGNVTLSTLATVRGKVTLMKMMKKRKTAHMNCSMIVNLPNQLVYDLACK
ncbi:late embryogenesis abundant protein At1g64065-like [Pyrus communis]|uniref:late embryogenesis abundant protein At1g64065-like n=1 Tax=Pyrus communis TaxID=23211 RepID=UPI0035C24327